MKGQRLEKDICNPTTKDQYPEYIKNYNKSIRKRSTSQQKISKGNELANYKGKTSMLSKHEMQNHINYQGNVNQK